MRAWLGLQQGFVASWYAWFAWDRPHKFGVSERAAVVALAGYSAHALQMLLDLRDRVTVAETLQRGDAHHAAGRVPGVELATQYRPAHAGKVGDAHNNRMGAGSCAQARRAARSVR
ncbi:hypothetical protein [Micromonospora inositola]|uniref:hypothetical protein n=1 Tax=Micromonospora inositola TaxID=47865 RepID=UPI000B5AC145|nr:hypothetical protein [Micromonospora inositola]